MLFFQNLLEKALSLESSIGDVEVIYKRTKSPFGANFLWNVPVSTLVLGVACRGERGDGSDRGDPATAA